VSFLKLAQSRQSIRAFTPQSLSDSQIEDVLAAAIAAPSAGNKQAWHFEVVRDPALKSAIAEQAAKQPWIATAPIVIVVCADPAQNSERYGERGRDLYTIQDTAAAIQNMLLCAVDLGLGGCWCGGFDERTAAEILDLPTHLRPIALLPIGYPGGPAPDPRPRRPISEVVNFR
jgi:nitroreductase